MEYIVVKPPKTIKGCEDKMARLLKPLTSDMDADYEIPIGTIVILSVCTNRRTLVVRVYEEYLKDSYMSKFAYLWGTKKEYLSSYFEFVEPKKLDDFSRGVLDCAFYYMFREGVKAYQLYYLCLGYGFNKDEILQFFAHHDDIEQSEQDKFISCLFDAPNKE